MQLIQIDPLELQAAQARVACVPEIFGTAVADALLQPVAETALRGDDEPLRIGMERLGDDLLAYACAVDVGGVDQRHAQLDRTAHDADALLAVADDTHRAETEPAHLELAPEQKRRIHGRDPTG